MHRNTDDSFDTVYQGRTRRKNLIWTLWQTGLAFSYKGRTLMVMQQVSNEPSQKFRFEPQTHQISTLKRIEVSIYHNELIILVNKLLDLNEAFTFPESIIELATKLLIMLSAHVEEVALSWFNGMLRRPPGDGIPFFTYIPCWKCNAGIESENNGEHFELGALTLPL
jgi:hypothetical protein